MTTERLRPRSPLFVSGDRPDRMRKAIASGADALILDLEDAVAPSNKAQARVEVAAFLREAAREVALFVRVNPLDSELNEADLDAILPGRPSGLVLPKAEGAASMTALDQRMQARGDTDGLVLPIATETARAMFRLDKYGPPNARLAGLT